MIDRKNQISFNILFVAFLVLVFSSCSPEYVPNMVNSPMFSNQGEFQATVATGNSNFDAQTAVAITNNIGIMLNGSYGNETSDSSDNFHKHSFLEGGVGYYNKIGDKLRYEIYSGYGYGTVEGYFRNGFVTEITTASYNRFFVQPGIGIATGIFDGSISPRIAIIQMNRTGDKYTPGRYNVFFEPVITSKIGYKYVKFIAQFGVSLPLDEQELSYDHQVFIFNFGINFNIGRKYYDF